jgi:hypothetical protein
LLAPSHELSSDSSEGEEILSPSKRNKKKAEALDEDSSIHPVKPYPHHPSIRQIFRKTQDVRELVPSLRAPGDVPSNIKVVGIEGDEKNDVVGEYESDGLSYMQLDKEQPHRLYHDQASESWILVDDVGVILYRSRGTLIGGVPFKEWPMLAKMLKEKL